MKGGGGRGTFVYMIGEAYHTPHHAHARVIQSVTDGVYGISSYLVIPPPSPIYIG